ncbi:MAG: PhoH family protein, partial [Bacillota bacterium]
SKVVVTGDVTQVDLPEGTKSGLVQVQRVLKNVPGISFCYLTERDVVRNDLVQLIIKAYEAAGGGGTGLLPPRLRNGQENR